jgi:hypothetical protein
MSLLRINPKKIGGDTNMFKTIIILSQGSNKLILFYFTILILGLGYCNQTSTTEVVEKYNTGKIKVSRVYRVENSVKTIIQEKKFDEHGNLMYKEQISGKSKTIIEYFDNGIQKSEKKYYNNLRHGRWRLWYRNSRKKSLKLYREIIFTGKKSSGMRRGTKSGKGSSRTVPEISGVGTKMDIRGSTSNW